MRTYLWTVILSIAITLAPIHPCFAQANGVVAAANEAPPTEEKKKKVPKARPLERLLEYKDTGEAVIEEDGWGWKLVLAGAALFLTSAGSLFKGAVELVQTYPTEWSRKKRVKALKAQVEKIRTALETPSPSLRASGERLYETGQAFKAHVKRLKLKVHGEALHELDARTIAETIKKLRPQLKNKYPEWLHEYDALLIELNEKFLDFKKDFKKEVAPLEQASRQLLDVGLGKKKIGKLKVPVPSVPSVINPPIEYNIVPDPHLPPGQTALERPNGITQDITDPRRTKNLLHFAKRDCVDLVTSLSGAKIHSSRAIWGKVAMVVGGIGGGAGGWILFENGHSYIQGEHHKNIETLVAEQKTNEQAKVIAQVQKAQELPSLVKILREQRKNSSTEDNKLNQIYTILRDTYRKHLSKVASDIRKSKRMQINEEFEKQRQKFMKDDEFANGIIDDALAGAASSELKTADPKRLVTVLLATSGEKDEKLIKRLLMKHYAGITEYLWPLLVIDKTEALVDTATISAIVTDTTPKLLNLENLTKRSKTNPKEMGGTED